MRACDEVHFIDFVFVEACVDLRLDRVHHAYLVNGKQRRAGVVELCRHFLIRHFLVACLWPVEQYDVESWE